MAIFVVNPLAVPLATDVALADYGQATVCAGRTAAQSMLAAYFGAGWANGSVDYDTMFCVEGAFVVAGVLNGRQQTPFLGIPATNRHVTVPICIICQTNADCIQHIALYYDVGTLLRQLDLAVSAS